MSASAMFGDLQLAAQNHFESTFSAWTGRIDTAKAAKQLVAEGGEVVKDVLTAKGMAAKAVTMDSNVLEMINSTVCKYKEAASKLRKAQESPQVNGITGYEDFHTFAEAYESRAASYQKVLDTIKNTPPPLLGQSQMEQDALVLVQIQDGQILEVLRDKTNEGLAELQLAAEQGYEKAAKAFQDRMEITKAAKKLLEQGGEHAAAALFAKKLGVDAVSNDVEISHKIEKMVLLYEEAAGALRRAKSLPEVNGITGYEDFDAMADAYEQRANHYKQAIDLLKKTPEAPPMTATEEDALKIAQANKVWQATAGACTLRDKDDE